MNEEREVPVVNALQAVLDKAAQEPEADESKAAPGRRKNARKASYPDEAVGPDKEKVRAKFFRPSREDRKFIGGHFDQGVGKQLRLIAVEDDTTVQALLEEALNLLFVKKGRAKIQDIPKA